MKKYFGFIMHSPWYDKKFGFMGEKERGWYNGYVAIRRDLIPKEWETDTDDTYSLYRYENHPLEVHGGITFMGWYDAEHMQIIPVTDIPEFNELHNYYVFGWDYAHSGDDWEQYPFEVVKSDVLNAVEQVKIELLNHEN